MITNKTKLNMVIGFPLSHTLSPILHNTIYHTLQCDAVMLAHADQQIEPLLQAVKTLSVGLIAVTMPFKSSIMPLLDEVSEAAQALNAINTVIIRENKTEGHNTDVDGIAYALRETTLANKTILIIGAGGAANAAAWYLNKNKANLFWLNRTPEHALHKIKCFGGELVDATQIDRMKIDIIINTTPVGMFPHIDQSPLPNYQHHAKQILFDMVYNPIETMLMKNAKAQGATCISGLDMLIAQGIKQDELWLNQSIYTPALFNKLKVTLLNALQHP